MNRSCLAALATVLLLAGCAGPDERACGLLEDLPGEAGQAAFEEVREIAETAQQAQSPEIRTIGDEITLNLNRRRALENLAPGSFVQVIQANLDSLRQACRELETGGQALTLAPVHIHEGMELDLDRTWPKSGIERPPFGMFAGEGSRGRWSS